jgi:MerR-like DNA binding protein
VRDPASHGDLDGAGYPLGVTQLADLVGATPEKIRHWHNSGLLPARRTSGRHREFYAAAAVRAFYLNSLGRAGITILRDLAKGEGAALLLGVSAVLHDRAAGAARSDHDLLLRTAADLQQVGTGMLSSS